MTGREDQKTTVREKSRNIIPVIPPLSQWQEYRNGVKLDAVIEVITSEVPKRSYHIAVSIPA